MWTFLAIFVPAAILLVLFLRWFIYHEYRTGWQAGRKDREGLPEEPPWPPDY